jgi:hypothetical protein
MRAPSPESEEEEPNESVEEGVGVALAAAVNVAILAETDVELPPSVVDTVVLLLLPPLSKMEESSPMIPAYGSVVVVLDEESVELAEEVGAGVGVGGSVVVLELDPPFVALELENEPPSVVGLALALAVGEW